MLDVCKQQDILLPQAVYGYWPANAEGNDVIVYDPEEQDREVARFTLPRQARGGGLCVADFLRDVASGESDVLGLQIVPMGQRASRSEERRSGKSVSVRVDLGGRRLIKKNTKKQTH